HCAGDSIERDGRYGAADQCTEITDQIKPGDEARRNLDRWQDKERQKCKQAGITSRLREIQKTTQRYGARVAHDQFATLLPQVALLCRTCCASAQCTSMAAGSLKAAFLHVLDYDFSSFY